MGVYNPRLDSELGTHSRHLRSGVSLSAEPASAALSLVPFGPSEYARLVPDILVPPHRKTANLNTVSDETRP
eukprot:3893958-Rhodomonas_salina.4